MITTPRRAKAYPHVATLGTAFVIDINTGYIQMLATSSTGAVPVPSGYVMCNGAEYDKKLYPKLYSIYGSGTDTFKVPDMRGRVVVDSPVDIDGKSYYWSQLEQLTTPDGWG